MQLIIDSGGSKSEWMTAIEAKWLPVVRLSGFNPWQHQQQKLRQLIQEYLLQLPEAIRLSDIYFYGAGCADESNKKLIIKTFQDTFIHAKVYVYSDLMGAAHALFGNKSGIVCILGTGSNSGLYEGEKIAFSPPSLGFLMGDEGSGAWIGKTLAQQFFRKQMPEDLQQKFAQKFPVSLNEFLTAVYHENISAAYLAQYAYFAVENEHDPWIQKLIEDAFELFFQNNIQSIPAYNTQPIGFVGAVAYQFQDILRKILLRKNLTLSAVYKSPAQALMDHYNTK